MQLDQEQFNALLDHIGKTDWPGIGMQIFFQLIAAGLAAGSGYYFQLKFKERETIEKKEKQAYSFNESVVYLSSLLESIALHLEQLVLVSFAKEEAGLKELKRALALNKEPMLEGVFSSIRPIEIVDIEKFLARIPNIGSHSEIIQVSYRMRNEMLQFASISEERMFLLKNITTAHGIPKETIDLRYNEIINRTANLLISGESILDCAMYIAEELKPLAFAMKEGFRIEDMTDIKVFTLEKNPLHEKLRLDLKNLIDTIFLEHKGRMLHMEKLGQRA